jgi:predicted dehydrogenase
VARGAALKNKKVQVLALADLFPDRLDSCRQQLKKLSVDVANERCFTGFDAYNQLLAVPDINYVILAQPPHFRPAHLQAAIAAGKHVFMEKPMAVDGPGIRMVMEAGKLARQKNLGIVAGTQRRHQAEYVETVKRIQDGAVGDIMYAQAYSIPP